MSPSGVAVVMAARLKGFTQVVMRTGKVAARKALPMRAGLNILYPSPPNICLPTIIAKTAPKAALHKGKVGGRTKAKRSPLRRALGSLGKLLPLNHRKIYSAARLAKLQTPINFTAWRPKKKILAATAGLRAIITPHISLATVSLSRMCGEEERMRIL